MIRTPPLFLTILLAACGAEERRLTAPPVEVTERVSSRFPTVEVLDVSLPTSAAGEEIMVDTGDGTLVISDLLWADDPARAVTLQLSRNLMEITGARIAPEPWPFDGFPAARIDVRIERLEGTPNGGLIMAGQYFVADLDGRGRDTARLFTLSLPVNEGGVPLTPGDSRAQLVADLAEMIARQGL